MTALDTNLKSILFVTSTMPSSDTDPVPAFVRDEAIWFKKLHPELEISILAPHNAYSNTKKHVKQEFYDEYRFHYFWPFKWEKLTGRGIQPALKKNKLLYLQLPSLFVAEFFATWRLTRKQKPDLIYAHWFTPQAIICALVSKITRTPFVFDTQASDAIVLKNIPFSQNIVSWVCKSARAYTVPSQQTLDKLLYFSTSKNEKDILKKVTMVTYGTTPVKTSSTTTKYVRMKYGLDGKKVVYFIGRLVDRKGVDLLIQAFRKFDHRKDDLRLVIVGDGQDRENLEQLTKKLRLQKSVIFTGFLTGEERFALLQISDICAIPSINIGDQAEGLPVVFMEAITAGKVVVLSNATGAHEVVEDGKNAFIAEAGSVSSLHNKLESAFALTTSPAAQDNFRKEVYWLARQFQWPAVIKKRYEAFQPKGN